MNSVKHFANSFLNGFYAIGSASATISLFPNNNIEPPTLDAAFAKTWESFRLTSGQMQQAIDYVQR
ncbi:hypothetical protein AGMMS49938_03950 [Fibrobacterales bacterium]|nr:hypothetical protein AGMMS49938_03950 [Fibrobacterales bacterium]